MKVTVCIKEYTFGSVEIEVPDGMSKEDIEELAEEMVDNNEVEVEWGDETYRDYSA